MRRTLRETVWLEGRGLHTGEPSRLAIAPAPPGAGRIFRCAGPRGPVDIPARASFVQRTERATRLARDGASVETVEHVLAALYGLGIDDAILWVQGPEVPILDGSARPFVAAIRAGGDLRPAIGPVEIRAIEAPVEVRRGASFVRLEPARGFEVDVEVEYAALGRQRFRGSVTPESFELELAGARTFGFVHEAAALWAAGRARGAGLDCAVVFGPSGLMNPEGLRWSDEVARHKALDALGDLALAGVRLSARYRACRPGHDLNVALVQALEAHRSTDAKR